jgi:hypothetical protein
MKNRSILAKAMVVVVGEGVHESAHNQEVNARRGRYVYKMQSLGKSSKRRMNVERGEKN